MKALIKLIAEKLAIIYNCTFEEIARNNNKKC